MTTLGKMPTLYVLNAVRELVKEFSTQNEAQHEWGMHLKKVLEQVIMIIIIITIHFIC